MICSVQLLTKNSHGLVDLVPFQLHFYNDRLLRTSLLSLWINTRSRNRGALHVILLGGFSPKIHKCTTLEGKTFRYVEKSDIVEQQLNRPDHSFSGFLSSFPCFQILHLKPVSKVFYSICVSTHWIDPSICSPLYFTA